MKSPTTSSSKSRMAIGVCSAAAGIALFAGCSSGATDDLTTAGSSSTDSAGDTKMTAFEQCLSKNGVTMPARPDERNGPAGTAKPSGAPPSGGAEPSGTKPSGAEPSGRPNGSDGAGQAPPGVDAAASKKAQAACEQYAPGNP